MREQKGAACLLGRLPPSPLMSNSRFYVVDHWSTPASSYPRQSEGVWSISSQLRQPGLYKMQEVGAAYYVPEPIDLTVISEGNLVWFTDEPRHMYALAEIGLFRAYGTVIVGGLGLGLIHHFLRYNTSVTRVITIERAPELKTLIWPHMACGELIIGDFYEVLPTLQEDVQTIYTDFIFGVHGERTWDELNRQREFCGKYFPKAQFLEHGYQRQLDAEVVSDAARNWSSDAMFGPVKIVR